MTMTTRITAAATAPRTRAQAADRTRALRTAGTLLTLAGSTILMGIITAEALYPGTFSTGGNEISDLGGTRPPAGIVLQPSATIFNVSMLLIGAMVLAGSWSIERGFGRRSVTLPIALLGIGSLGVGLFPGNTGTPHALFAMATFISGGVAAVSAAQIAAGPFRYLSLLLGTVALGTLGTYMVLGEASPMAAMGVGGVERWIVYPIVLWIVAFGGYLCALGEPGREAGAQADREPAPAA